MVKNEYIQLYTIQLKKCDNLIMERFDTFVHHGCIQQVDKVTDMFVSGLIHKALVQLTDTLRFSVLGP